MASPRKGKQRRSKRKPGSHRKGRKGT
jgi:hypothetical protein